MEYKGFRLRPVANETSEGKWSMAVVLERPAEDDAEDYSFYGTEVFATAEEAEKASIAMGREIIDGEHPKFALK